MEEPIAALTRRLPYLADLLRDDPSLDDLGRVVLDRASSTTRRREAMVALHHLAPREKAVDVLIEVVDGGRSDDPEVVSVAIETLSVLSDAGTVPVIAPALVSVCRGGYDDEVREGAAHALQFAITDESAACLLEVATAIGEPTTLRGQAIESLTMSDPLPAVVTTLFGLLEDPEPEVVFWTVHTLAVLRAPGAAEAIEAIRERDWPPAVSAEIDGALAALAELPSRPPRPRRTGRT